MSEIGGSAGEGIEELKRRKLQVEVRDLRIWSPLKVLLGGAIALATTGLAFCANSPLQERLRLERIQTELEQQRLAASTEQTAKVLRSVFSEPSDLTLTCLESDSGQPLFLMVDDEVGFPLIVAPVGTTLLPVGRLPQVDADDLEIAARLEAPLCESERYIVAASHRKVNDERETRVSRLAVRRSGKDNGQFAADAEEFTLIPGLKTYFGKNPEFGFDGNKMLADRDWTVRNRDDPESHEYALELEAASVLDKHFWVGLKFPLYDGRAVVLRYDVAEIRDGSFDLDDKDDENDGPTPRGHELVELGGNGISAMTAHDGRMLVVSNPPGDGGGSLLHFFDVGARGWEPVGDSVDLSRAGQKAEGIAVHGEKLWVAYDGKGEMLSLPLENVMPR